MCDHNGAPLGAWLPEMQSTEFLRQSIASGHRTEECWAELQARSRRRQAFHRLLPKFRAAAAAARLS
jgi:hypothetical protein